ncbi:MAG: TolC family protein [Gemmataceae bacterium]|nr:TolC family protein [Gemmataceae bacterium]
MTRMRRAWARVAGGLLGAGLATAVFAQASATDRPTIEKAPMPQKSATAENPLPGPPPGTILQPGENPIDLGTALRLAGVENPELLLARARIAEVTAQRQLAVAQLLPNLNAGTNYDLHRGALQQSTGNILQVHRDALYVGLGANAIGAGTVAIPGLNYNLNVGAAWYGYLASRQRVVTANASAAAVRNDVLLRVCLAYLDLLRGEGRQAISRKNRQEAAEIARLTAEFARTGQGRKADADRATVELKRRDAELTQAEGETLAASARLAQLLNLDPSVRLRPIDGWVVPAPIVPDPTPLPDLLAIALLQRPELASRRSEVRTALYELSLARVLPFAPNVILGFSAGGFGGGSNLVADPPGFIAGDGRRITAPRFSSLDSRTDLDVAVFWTFRNMGIGNLALIRAADSRARQARLRELETLNLVRAQVAEAYGWVQTRFLQIEAGESAVRASRDAYAGDLIRIRGGQGLPLEVVDSLRLLGRSRYEYLDSIIEYNRVQFQLWVALGQPPANCLARPVPSELVPPPTSSNCPEPTRLPAPQAGPAPARVIP